MQINIITNRIQHLDSLRGVAAILVVASHCLQAVDVEREFNSIRIALGHFPVLFFFVLSGYVLSRPLVRKELSLQVYFSYSIKRFFRLIPLLWVVFFVSFVFARSMNAESLGNLGVSQWVCNLTGWMAQVQSLNQFWENLLLIQRGLNVPTWTIKIEIVCSMLLPIFIFLANRSFLSRWGVLLILCFFGSEYFNAVFSVSKADLTLFESSRYLYLFMFGYILCFFDEGFQNRRFVSIVFLFAFIGLLLSTLWVNWAGDLVQGLIIMGIMAIMIPMPFVLVKKILNNKVLLLGGEISYGIYLFHTPVLLFVLAGPFEPWFGGFTGVARFPILFLQVFMITIVLSYVASRFIELPFNRLGYYLAGKIMRCFQNA